MVERGTTTKNGPLVGAVQVSDRDEIMLISDQGTAVRTRVDEISVLGRNTQGVRLIRLAEDEKLVELERIGHIEGEEEEDEGGDDAPESNSESGEGEE